MENKDLVKLLSTKKYNILVIAITRMGDLIQSVPFLECLQAENTDAEIHLLVEDCFYDVAAMLPAVSQVHTVRLEDLLPDLSSPLAKSNLAKCINFYSAYIKNLSNYNYLQVWNLTHTRPSMYLNYLLANENGCGVTLDRVGFQKVNSPWLRYFFATNLARPWCQFNLVDIYANAVTPEVTEHRRELRIKLFNSQTKGELKGVIRNSYRIAIHTGASQISKQWPVSHFEKLIQLLSVRDFEIILVGSKNDKRTAEYLSQKCNIINKVGETTPCELTELLAGCDLFISNDSGPMHIAAAVNTKVIALTVGSALGSETAPYGMNHWVVEPDADCFPCDSNSKVTDCSCKSHILPELINEIVLHELRFQKEVNPDYLVGARVYQTEFDSRTGMLCLQSRFISEDSLRDKLNHFIAPYWKALLNRQPMPESSGCKHISEEIHRLACKAETSIESILDCLNKMTVGARKQDVDVMNIKKRAKQLEWKEVQLERILSSHKFLKSIFAYLQISKASLSSADLNGQLNETKVLYAEIASLINTLSGNKKETHITYISNQKESRHENQNQRLLPV